MATFLYPHLLKRQKIHSGLKVAIEAAPNERIIQNVLQNAIELGIITQPSFLPALEYESLGFESLCLVLPAKYDQQPLSFDCLKALGFMDHPDGAHYADRLLGANFKEQFDSVEKLKKTGYINQINQILLPVSEGLGFTVLPEIAVRHFPHQSLLFVAPLEVPIQDELFLVRKKHRVLPKRYDWFEKRIKELVRK
jgi:DNA-binding transcriptional LysR family regulator